MTSNVAPTKTSTPFNWKKADRGSLSIRKFNVEINIRLLSGHSNWRRALGGAIAVKDIFLGLALKVSDVGECTFKGLRNVGVGIGTLDGKLALRGIVQLTRGALNLICLPLALAIEIASGVFITIPWILIAPDSYRKVSVESLNRLNRL